MWPRQQREKKWRKSRVRAAYHVLEQDGSYAYRNRMKKLSAGAQSNNWYAVHTLQAYSASGVVERVGGATRAIVWNERTAPLLPDAAC